MKTNREFKWNVGGSLIILIIVVFALAIFSVLSIKASNSDLVLAKKTRDSVEEYYNADAEAEILLMKINQQLLEYRENPSGEVLKVRLQMVVGDTGVVDAKSDKTGSVEYSIKMNEYATLDVSLEYNVEEDNNTRYNVVKWAVNQSEVGDPSYENSSFWDGTIEE